MFPCFAIVLITLTSNHDVAAGGAQRLPGKEVGILGRQEHGGCSNVLDLADAADRIKAITGRIDLVHCNNSRDEFASGADRHANFPAGTIDPQALVAVVRAAGAPVVCETPEPGLAEDIGWLQAQVS